MLGVGGGIREVGRRRWYKRWWRREGGKEGKEEEPYLSKIFFSSIRSFILSSIS